VGRSSDRAFCYLLVPDPNRLTAEAKRRLEVLQEHSELGSGLQIAHQDLDLRGAGNVLGRDQSGHVESVGFELFTELLEQAVLDAKGEERLETFEPEVKVPVGAYLSEAYIEDVGQRLAFYKRFSLAESEDALDELVGELEDRYGPAPPAARALRDVVAIKQILTRLRIDRLESNSKLITLRLREDTLLDPGKVTDLLTRARGRYEFRPDMSLVRHVKGRGAEAILAEALTAARDVADCGR
jgi:transcription-repair coupling factor (superfamily II helicase)